MSGYCAMGSVESAIAPTSVMTILITPAKIGRSMKKCGKFIAIAVAPEPSSFFARCLKVARLCVWPTGRRWFGYRRDRQSGLDQLQTGRHDLLTLLQSL